MADETLVSRVVTQGIRMSRGCPHNYYHSLEKRIEISSFDFKFNTHEIVTCSHVNIYIMASNPFIESHCMCMVFPLSSDFIIESGHFRLKHERNGPEPSKYIKNKCTH